MLALIIEKITKLSYKDAMHQIIFRPLGMKNTLTTIGIKILPLPLIKETK
jgi:CubicO group peptidase (beta-lactamase class C family)